MKRQNLLAGILSLGCAMALLTAARAQQADNATIDIQITHGQLYYDNTGHGEATLSNVVFFLQARDTRINVVMGKDVGQIRIGDLQLHEAPVDLTLKALNVASGNKFVITQHPSGMQMAPPLFILETNQPPSPPKSETRVVAFNLTGYIQHVRLSCQDTNKWEEQLRRNLDGLEGIVQETVAAQRELDPQLGSLSWPRFRFYREADLLIVIGSSPAVETAITIISALPGEQPRSAGGFDPFAHAAQDYGDALQKYRLELDQLKKLWPQTTNRP
ncbi:MAG: hypothetical protein ABSH38_19660 [Verrucomicrobiota bacterium]